MIPRGLVNLRGTESDRRLEWILG